MLNKKMLLSVLVLGFVATVAGAGTFAYFDSEQISAANTITSGTLKLDVKDDGDNLIDSFAIGGTTGLKPGDSGNAKTYTLKNSGSLPGKLIATVTVTNGDKIPNLATTLTSASITNGAVLTNGATIDFGTVNAGAEIPISIDYVYTNVAGAPQNTEQDQTVTYSITYTMTQV